ncbi:MAG TPA: hypothetical protein PKY87_12465 [Terricaulis sp.]|nr:hypothetical protein [Terricaulis sp.]
MAGKRSISGAGAALRGGGLAARMENEPAARRLSADAPAPNRSGKVVNLKPAADYYAACAGTKTG